MKYNIETLLDHPAYFHRVIAYALRNTPYVDDFGIPGVIFGQDDRLYVRLDCVKDECILGYINDFEFLKHMYMQGGKVASSNRLWLEAKARQDGADFEKCSDDYAKMMLFLNFGDKQDYYSRFIQYKIRQLGKRSAAQSIEQRKAEVAKLKADNRDYLDRLADEIYYDVFSLMLDNYYHLQEQQDKNKEFLEFVHRVTDHDGNYSQTLMDIYRRDHPARFAISKDSPEGRADMIVSLEALPAHLRGKKSGDAYKQKYITKVINDRLKAIQKDDEDLQRFTALVMNNQDAIKMWKKTGGKKYFKNRLAVSSQSASMVEKYGVNSEYTRQQNILYRLPQFSSLNEETASCSLVGLRDIDYVPLFQTFVDDYKEDCYQKSISGSKAKYAERGTN